MSLFQEHSARRPLIDELHARPFTPLTAPSRIIHFAFMSDGEEVERPTVAEAKAHLSTLLDALGSGVAPAALPNHYVAEIGDLLLKWEFHTEFVSVTLTELSPDLDGPLFDPSPLRRLPDGWLEAAPGRVICATLAEARSVADEAESLRVLDEALGDHFNRDSWAVSFVASRLALATSDFRCDPNGFVRMAILAQPSLGPRRLGRVTQRLLELETYRTLAMLALPVAREMSGRLGQIDETLRDMAQVSAAATAAEAERATLEKLTGVAAELESLAAGAAFRFGAARAYSAIVDERVEVLREERARDRQIFREFMTRRFKPAMRTVSSVEGRVAALSERAERAANLLRTRVDVTLEGQNQALLRSMNRRAQLQLRLQQTVEGLSVVAISYYAVSLAGYLLEPVGTALEISEALLKAVVAIPIIAAVAVFVRRLRRHAERSEGEDAASD